MFSDPAFTENRKVPIHRWVPWIAGFSSNFVSDVIRKYRLKPTDNTLIFDPFAGVGTTPLEAKMMGFTTKSVEINPYACMACRVKLNWNINLKLFSKQIDKLDKFVTKIERTKDDFTIEKELPEPKLKPPSKFKTREPFFDPLTERKILQLKEFIYEVPGELQEHFKVAFGTILVKCSNYAYGPSLGRKSKMEIKQTQNMPAGKHFIEKIKQMYEDLKWLKNTVIPKLPREPKHEVYEGNVFSYINDISDVDLIVTSPPYLNNYHYPRNTRPQMYWLDIAEKPSDFEKIECESFGKFWQTVRESTPIDLDFSSPELERVIEQIRKRNPNKGIYGGEGWANYATVYFNDVHRFFKNFFAKMKGGGIMVWVLGNSILQGVEVKTEEFLVKIAELEGFKKENIYRIRKKRVGNSIVNTHVRTTPEKPVELYEAAVVLSK